MLEKPIVFFDSECTLCTRFKKAIEMVDSNKSIRFVSINDDDVFTHFPELDEEACFEEVHLLDTDRKVYKGEEVVEFIVKLIPQSSKFSWLLESSSGQKAMKVFYDRINEIRKFKKKCSTCR